MPCPAHPVLASQSVAVDSDGGISIGDSESISQVCRTIGFQRPVFVDILGIGEHAIRNAIRVGWIDDVFKPVFSNFVTTWLR